MAYQVEPPELERQRQLNSIAMSSVGTGGVQEMAVDPAKSVQIAGKGAAFDAMLSIFGAGKKLNKGEATPAVPATDTERGAPAIDVKPRVSAEGNLEPDNLGYKQTQDVSASEILSEEGQAKFAAQGNTATDLSPSGQRMSAALQEADDAVDLTADQQLAATVTSSQRGVTADQQGFNLTEDSAGVASLDQAEEVLTGQMLGKSYLQSIEEGAPFNWNNIKQPDDVKSLIQAVSDSLPDEQLAATRGVISNAGTVEAATAQLADSLGVNRRILKRKTGTTFANAADATAARMVLADSAKKLAKLAEDVQNGVGGDATMLLFRRQLAIHNGIQLQIKGAQTEAARLLQSFNIPVTDGMAPEAAALMNLDVIEASGGARTLRMAATGLVQAAKNGNGAFNLAAEKGIGKRFKQGMETLYINGLLSNPRTNIKNVAANMLFMFHQIPEEIIAGFYGTGERAIRRVVGSEIDYTKQVYVDNALVRIGGMYHSFGDAWKAAAAGFRTGEPGDTIAKTEVNQYRDLGNSENPFFKAMQRLHNSVNIPTRLLLGGDEFFKVLSQNGELYVAAHRQMKAAKAAGMTNQQVIDEGMMVMLSPRQIAGDLDFKSRYDTYMSDLGGLGTAMSSLQNTMLGRFVLPFATAPTNDILRTMERSPIGLLTGLPDIVGKDAGKRQRTLGRLTFAGVTISYMSMYAMQGRITGSIPKDPKVREKLPKGWKPYSLVFRDKNFPRDEDGDMLPPFDAYGVPNGDLTYVSYAGMGTLAAQLGIVASTVQRLTYSRNPEETQNEVTAAIAASADYYIELPFLKSVANIIDAFDQESYDRLVSSQLGSANLFVPVPNPASSLVRAVDTAIDPSSTRTGADFDIYTRQDVDRMSAEGELKLLPNGRPDYRLVGMYKGDLGDKFRQAMYDGYYETIKSNPVSENINANIPQYDTLGRNKNRGVSFEENPWLAVNNAVNPVAISSSEKQPKWIEELVRLDWPIPRNPKKYKGVVLTELQKSQFIWLAKGNPDEMPPSLDGLGVKPVKVKTDKSYNSFTRAIERRMKVNKSYRRGTTAEKRNLISSLNDEFLEAAWNKLIRIPGNEKLGIAARDIQRLKDRGLL